MSTLAVLLQSGLAWFLFGALLLIVEFTIGGFLAVFFAAGAWVTALGLWIGLLSGSGWPVLVFVVVSVATLVLLRKRSQEWLGRHSATLSETMLDDFVGKSATVVETIDAARNTGQIELRGSTWSARAAERIPAGEIVEIVARDNLTLHVKPLGGNS